MNLGGGYFSGKRLLRIRYESETGKKWPDRIWIKMITKLIEYKGVIDLPLRQRRLGLELNDTLLKLVEVSQKKKQIRVEQVVSHPLPSVWNRDGVFIEQEELTQSVKEALTGRRFSTRKVHVALNSRHVMIQHKQVPIMKKRQLPRYLKEHILPTCNLPFTDPMLNYLCLEQDQIAGTQNLLLVMVSKSYIETLIKIIEQCGLQPVWIDLSSLSLFRWLSYVNSKQPMSTKLLTLNFSVTGVELSLFKDGDLQEVSYIPLQMAAHRHGEDHPQPDPLKPILLESSEVESYGKALLLELQKQLQAWEEAYGWKPQHWLCTGEGIDFSLLQTVLTTEEIKVTTSDLPEELLSNSLQESASRWIGASLSVPIGLLLDGKVQMI
ncbi:type IV pilus biogenesis protein PilM [Hazenella coriacea]|uniref:Tfp pilus assembly PilM family ATPase n=1 Tax=Hazenella coriacea TaxID=1179467 RepID=A0A4R3LB51_9BACL|nr:pilus assembly protein PilM [Hazenella coriacea]TCS96508.1 Tfp pilus assembly PilM family ATPase [Hazenella coriacea]